VNLVHHLLDPGSRLGVPTDILSKNNLAQQRRKVVGVGSTARGRFRQRSMLPVDDYRPACAYRPQPGCEDGLRFNASRISHPTSRIPHALSSGPPVFEPCRSMLPVDDYGRRLRITIPCVPHPASRPHIPHLILSSLLVFSVPK